MRYYRAFINFKDFISIDETELETALRAHATDGKAFFAEGSTSKIYAILPDYHKMMGFNEGYVLTPEDSGMIARSKKCQDAKLLLSKTKELIAGREPPVALQGGAKELAESKALSSQ